MDRSKIKNHPVESEDGEISDSKPLKIEENIAENQKRRKTKSFPLIVSNLPQGISRMEVEKVFSKYGEVIRSSFLVPNDYGVREGDICVDMKSIESGRKILKEVHKTAVFESHPEHEISIKFYDEDIYNPTKLYVSHIPKECSEEDVTQVFSRFGAIQRVVLLKFPDGSSKGCGFVEFVTNEAATAAILNMHHRFKMNNSPYNLIVKFSGQNAHQPRGADCGSAAGRSEFSRPNPPPKKKKHGPKHPEIEYAQEIPQQPLFNTQEQMAAAYYQQYYAYANCAYSMQPPQNAFYIPAQAYSASSEGKNTASEAASASGKAFQKGPTVECNLYVGNVPLTYTEEDLCAMFRPFGRVKSAILGADHMTKASKGYGFVSFEDSASASLAIQQTNGLVIGGKKLRVSVKK